MSSQLIAFVQRRFSRVRVDLRDALRGLRGGRETTVVAFVILTLTMAAGTVTFSVVDAVALRPLPYASPERLVSVTRDPERRLDAAASGSLGRESRDIAGSVAHRAAVSG